MRKTKEAREIIFVNVEIIVGSNSKIDSKKLDRMIKYFKPSKFGILSALETETGYKLADGHHRLLAAKKAGYRYIPLVPLTVEEFNSSSDSDAQLDIDIRYPRFPMYVIAPNNFISYTPKNETLRSF